MNRMGCTFCQRHPLLRLYWALALLILVSGCVTHYQPRFAEDGFYHEGERGPDFIIVESRPFGFYDPVWYPWWSLQWFYFDQYNLTATPPAAAVVRRTDPPRVDERRVQQRGVRLPPPVAMRPIGLGDRGARQANTGHRPTHRDAAGTRPTSRQEP